MDRESFIEELSRMSKEEIDTLIKNKGKEPKRIPIILFFQQDDIK